MAVMKFKKKCQSVTQIWLKWTQKSNLMAFLSCLQNFNVGTTDRMLVLKIMFFFEPNNIFMILQIPSTSFAAYKAYHSRFPSSTTARLLRNDSFDSVMVISFFYFFFKTLPLSSRFFANWHSRISRQLCVCPIVKSLCINIQFVGQQGWFRLQRRRRRPTDWLTDGELSLQTKLSRTNEWI